MKLFYSTDHQGHWPVGVASIVVAESEGDARRILTDALAAEGLRSNSSRDDGFSLVEVDLSKSQAIILNNGDY